MIEMYCKFSAPEWASLALPARAHVHELLIKYYLRGGLDYRTFRFFGLRVMNEDMLKLMMSSYQHRNGDTRDPNAILCNPVLTTLLNVFILKLWMCLVTGR